MYIYRLYCKNNGRSYVGRTTTPSRREAAHRWHLAKGTHRSAEMQGDYQRYGPAAFVFTILEEIRDLGVVTKREGYWAMKYRCYTEGYNSYRATFDVRSQIKAGGEGAMIRGRHTGRTAFATFVRAQREELGLTQLDVARWLGLKSGEHIGLVETAQRFLDLDKVPQLARVLKCNVQDLAQLALSEQYPVLYRSIFGNGVPKRPRT